MRLEALYINVWNGVGYDDMKNTPPYSKGTSYLPSLTGQNHGFDVLGRGAEEVFKDQEK